MHYSSSLHLAYNLFLMSRFVALLLPKKHVSALVISATASAAGESTRVESSRVAYLIPPTDPGAEVTQLQLHTYLTSCLVWSKLKARLALLLNDFRYYLLDETTRSEKMATICNFGHSLNLFAVRVQIIGTLKAGRWTHRSVINEEGRSFFNYQVRTHRGNQFLFVNLSNM